MERRLPDRDVPMPERTPTDPPQTPRRARGRKWSVALLIVSILVAAVVFVSPVALAPLVQRKLQAMVEDHLHARLEIGSLQYHFPYGVTVRDVSLVARDPALPPDAPSVQILGIGKLDLRLAELPFHDKPIVVENLAVERPVLNLVRLEDGSWVGPGLLQRARREPPPEDRRIKLSDALRLRQFTVTDANVRFEDRTRASTKPMEWRGIDARLELAPQTASKYGFHFSADNKQVAHVDLAGSADVDALDVTVDKLVMNATARRDEKSSPLPAQLQELLHELGLEGAVRFEARGAIPLKDPTKGNFKLDAALDRVSMRPPTQPWSLDHLSMALYAQREPEKPEIDLKLVDVSARGVGGALDVSEATGTIDIRSRSWKLSRVDGKLVAGVDDGATTQAATTRPSLAKYLLAGDVEFTASAAGSLPGASGAPSTAPVASTQPSLITSAQLVMKFDQLDVQPPGFGQVIENLSGTIRLADHAALLEDLTATYGSDQLTLKHALVPLDDLKHRIDVREVVAEGFFAQPSPPYPEPLDELARLLRPAGVYSLTGAASVYRGRGKLEPDYALRVVPRGASVTLTNKNLTIADLQGEINIMPARIDVRYVEGRLLGRGAVALRGTVWPREPVKYDGHISVQDADLSELSRTLSLFNDDGSTKLTGKALVRARFNGEVPPNSKSTTKMLAGFHSRGTVRVADGDFWSVSVLDGIVKHVRVARNALTAGQAALLFEAKDGQVQLEKFAIASTALGIQGSGSVGIDGNALELNVIAAPLGDWRARIKNTGIPLFSRMVGEAVGAIQRVVNSATSQLLYQFRVSGSVSDPRVRAVPAPFLTDNAARLFGLMLNGTRAEKLDEAVAGKEATEEP